jgi:Uncharacterized conserved protein
VGADLRPGDLPVLRGSIEEAGLPLASAAVTMHPNATISLEGPDAVRVLRLIDELEESDDVQEVFSNFDVPDEVMAEIAG